MDGLALPILHTTRDTGTQVHDIINRIRKILARTEEAGCTEAEAATAMALASRLMAEHNLSMSEVETTDSTAAESWAEDSAHQTGRWSMEYNLAYYIVKEFFFVEGTLTPGYRNGKRSKTLWFFGKQSNVETAKWAFTSLLESFNRLFGEYRNRTRCPATDRRAFAAGVAQGFRAKMREEREVQQVQRDITSGIAAGGTALALRSIQQETAVAFREKHGKLKSSGSNYGHVRDSGGARQAGYAAGRNLNLARPIGQSNRRGITGS
jgi:hypothetical protein